LLLPADRLRAVDVPSATLTPSISTTEPSPPRRVAMSERETQTPGPPIVDDQNAMLGDTKPGELKPGASKCPFAGHQLAHTLTGAKGNNDWWPEQLNVSILHQQSSLSNPMSEEFDYASE